MCRGLTLALVLGVEHVVVEESQPCTHMALLSLGDEQIVHPSGCLDPLLSLCI